MTLAAAIPWWAITLLVAVAVLVAYGAYARPVLPLTLGQRVSLTGFRLLALLLILFFLLRPVATDPASTADAVVPVLLDRSRSMRIADVDGMRRIDQAVALLNDAILPGLGDDFEVETLAFGDEVGPIDPAAVEPDASRTDLVGALEAVRARYPDRSLAGIVLLSDGGDTSGREAASVVAGGMLPVYAVGVGALRPPRDREVASLTAGDATVTGSVVDISASVVSHGFELAPIEVQLLEDGRLLQVRRVTPPAGGSPVRIVFPVSPKTDVATVYTVEIPADEGEVVAENNRRSVLVRPPGRPRRLLMLEGAPGYEHSFLKRVWLADRGVALDAVVRKGQNDRGEHTFYVQGAPDRTAALATGFPADRAALFDYHALVVANVEPAFFRREQLAMIADFVAERGGGLLLLGSVTLTGRGFAGSSVEDVVPLELSGRIRTDPADAAGETYTVMLTDDGAAHPMMQLGSTVSETREQWSEVPRLGGNVPVGPPKPGASVLARILVRPGGSQPLVAVQRYGSGRSMIFAGEAAWRWKMLLPAEGRTYDTFWGQVARWLAASAPEPVAVTTAGGRSVGDRLRLDVHLRNTEYRPILDATPRVRVFTPAGEAMELQPRLADAATGRYAAEFAAGAPGVYRVEATAAVGERVPVTAEEWILIGGADAELTDPRLHDQVLRRVATASSGRYLEAADLDDLRTLLLAGAPNEAPPVTRELWHGVWSFLLVVVVLTAEWSLRRAWGMR